MYANTKEHGRMVSYVYVTSLYLRGDDVNGRHRNGFRNKVPAQFVWNYYTAMKMKSPNSSRSSP